MQEDFFTGSSTSEQLCGRDIRKPNLACPKCSGKLIDSVPNIVTATVPPKLEVNCLSCNYVGFRVY